MSGTIRMVSTDTVKMISAGQVITSLFSVVKELVENGFDAGATNVDVFVEDCGLSTIKVTDNGSGIPLDEDSPILRRRSSSKRDSALFSSVSTGGGSNLGFRGEALHSLAEVSDLRIETMTSSMSESKLFYLNKATKELTVARGTRKEVGTTVTVTGLFEPMPVRRQELVKSKKRQLTAMTWGLKCLAISHPSVRLFAQHKDASGAMQTLCSSQGKIDLSQAVGNVLGGKILANLHDDQFETEEFKIRLFVSKVGTGKASSDMQLCFLDGRMVSIPKLCRMAAEVFAQHHPHTSSRVQPVLIVEIKSTDSHRDGYDVNVAPDKRNVVIEGENALIKAVQERLDTILGSCKQDTLIGMSSAKKPAKQQANFVSFSRPSVGLKRQREKTPDDHDFVLVDECDEDAAASHTMSGQAVAAHIESDPTPETLVKIPVSSHSFSTLTSNKCEKELSTAFTRSSFGEVNVLGQFNKGFIVAEHRGNVFIVDQHAADEKSNYERLKDNYKARPQPLIQPARVELDPEEFTLAMENVVDLREHGFVVESDPTAAHSLLVKAVPVLQYDSVQPSDIREMTDQLRTLGRIVRPPKAAWHSLATKACRTSIMIGTTLEERTMVGVVRHLGDLDQPWNCPHGRPTMRFIAALTNNDTTQLSTPIDLASLD